MKYYNVAQRRFFICFLFVLVIVVSTLARRTRRVVKMWLSRRRRLYRHTNTFSHTTLPFTSDARRPHRQPPPGHPRPLQPPRARRRRRPRRPPRRSPQATRRRRRRRRRRSVGLQAQQTSFKLKAPSYPFHSQSFKPGCFQARVSLHRPLTVLLRKLVGNFARRVGCLARFCFATSSSSSSSCLIFNSTKKSEGGVV